MLQRLLLVVLLVGILFGCAPSAKNSISNAPKEQQVAAQSPATQVAAKAVSVDANLPVAEAKAEQSADVAAPTQAKPTAAPTNTPQSKPVNAQPVALAVGPDQFPEGVSPLTGLPVENSENLSLPPALVSVTNFPITARPQAGLSYSPFVFEMYIGEGMTRFLALFHGNYPQQSESAGAVPSGESIGPVRSGRLPYESLRKLYNGFLVMASASPNVKSSLNGFTNVFGTDSGDINSAMIPVSKLEGIAQNSGTGLDEGVLSGLRFEQNAPQSGKEGNGLWIPYNFLNQVIWRYDAASGAYHRYQDAADGKTFVQATDRLNGDPLTYENVVVLFAQHRAKAETLIDIDLMYISRMPALLFRDGKMYEIFWTTANADFEKTTGHVRPIRFVDAQGNPFPLKPGQTWVELVQPMTRYNETVDTEAYFDMKRKSEPGSGFWAVHFYPTVPEKK